MLSNSTEDSCEYYRKGIKLTYDFSQIFMLQFQAKVNEKKFDYKKAFSIKNEWSKYKEARLYPVRRLVSK